MQAVSAKKKNGEKRRGFAGYLAVFLRNFDKRPSGSGECGACAEKFASPLAVTGKFNIDKACWNTVK
jgi:hypothetical protein